MLIDILEYPNLRAHCLSWLGENLPQTLRSPRKFRGHIPELLYGALVLLYVVVMVYVAMVLYRVTLKT